MMKKIILWTFVVLILSIFILTASISLAKPQWFIVEVPKYNINIDSYVVENKSSGEPYYECKINNITYQEDCKFVNLPTDKPYITQTKFAPLYTYQNYFIIFALIVALILNWEKLKQWIQKIRTSSN